MSALSKSKRGWRIARRFLIVVAVITTLITIFYTEEDWRGYRAWENCKRQLEAQGVVLDWNKYLPPPVPDDQNFYTASSNILLKFKQLSPGNSNAIEAVRRSQWLKLNPLGSNGDPCFPILDTSRSGPIVVAKMIVISQASAREPGPHALVVKFDDPTAATQVKQLLQGTVGQTISGVQGFEFSQFQWNDLQPAQIDIRAETLPSLAELEAFVPSGKIGERGHLRVTSTVDPKIFEVTLNNIHITSAADYLKWSDRFVPAFDEIREALQRPYAILPGDYSQPYDMPIPNFVIMRELAQTLGQRAQCYLLLREPEKALLDLMLVHHVCRILDKPPIGQPETLVEAMINVAITDLYAQIIAQGIREHTWQEPQLEALQHDLAGINVETDVVRSFQSQPARTCRDFEMAPASKIKEWFRFGRENTWQKLMDLKWHLMPRGWIFQNMVTAAQFESEMPDGFDSTNGMVRPQNLAEWMHSFDKVPGRYKFLVKGLLPNFTKACQTTAYNQTLVNEGQIACALERDRLAKGEYPDSLEALIPQYMNTIPRDIIGGQPLHYHRAADGKFLLYSVGWDGRDNGGRVIPNGNGVVSYSAGDWVWPN